MPHALVGFDLDKTLINSASWYRLNLAMGMTDAEDEALYNRGPEKAGELSYQQWLEELAVIYRSRGRATKSAMENILLEYSLLDEPAATIRALQAADHEVALVTGGFQLVADHVANRLGIKYVRANIELLFDDTDHFTDLRPTLNDDRQFKVNAIQAFAAELDIPDSKTFYVADGDNDDLVFQAVRGIQVVRNGTHHETWKAKAIESGELFSFQSASQYAEFVINSLQELPELLATA